MFSVYGVAGRVFNGPLDQMRQVGGVNTLTRSRAVAAIGQDPSATDTGENIQRASASASGSGSGTGTPRRSIAAYVQEQGGDTQRRPLTQVRDVMSHNIFAISIEATVQDAWQALAARGVGQAPVVNANASLVGMLLRGDLLRPELMPAPNLPAVAWRAWLAQSVANVMWTPVPSAHPQTELRHVARVLLDTGLPGLPVVDAKGAVSGFVSRTDLLRAIVNDPPLDLWS